MNFDKKRANESNEISIKIGGRRPLPRNLALMSMGEASGAHAHSRKVGSAKLKKTLLKKSIILKGITASVGSWV